MKRQAQHISSMIATLRRELELSNLIRTWAYQEAWARLREAQWWMDHIAAEESGGEGEDSGA